MCTSQLENANSLDTREKIGFPMNPPPQESLTTQKLPTPWLADSEWLLKELAKTRETILRIPQRLDNASDIKSAIDRIWYLERTLRDLLHLHREGQRSFVKKAEAAQRKASKTAAKTAQKIIRLQRLTY
ncbi:MAG: hypothetical protein QOJ87_760 [Verrucomicrobiota bacterium]|jgi:hypothetical protein